MKQSVLTDLIQKLNDNKIFFEVNKNLSSLTSFKIGGVSPIVLSLKNSEEAIYSISILDQLDLLYKILGGGSNLLISDFPDDFVVLKLDGTFKEYSQNGDFFYIGSGCNTTPTFRKISELGFTGAEFLSTIPGKVGGAIIQNAGCYGGELFNIIEYVDVIKDSKLLRLYKKDIQYGYRTTQFLINKNSIIVGTGIRLNEGNIEEIEFSLKEKREKRNSSQPENKKSAGSVFKNPVGIDENGTPLKAWKLIDTVGMRGEKKGGALVSPEHCNFIVNTGDAKATDVNYLVKTIQEKVHKRTGILLEREIEYWGKID